VKKTDDRNYVRTPQQLHKLFGMLTWCRPPYGEMQYRTGWSTGLFQARTLLMLAYKMKFLVTE